MATPSSSPLPRKDTSILEASPSALNTLTPVTVPVASPICSLSICSSSFYPTTQGGLLLHIINDANTRRGQDLGSSFLKHSAKELALRGSGVPLFTELPQR